MANGKTQISSWLHKIIHIKDRKLQGNQWYSITIILEKKELLS